MTFSSKRFGRALTFFQSPGAWREAGVKAEITGEKRGVAEIVVPGKLLQRLVCAGKFLLEFEYDIVVDQSLGTVARNAFRDDIQIFG